MEEERRQILEMLAKGKINSEEAEKLLNAVDKGSDVESDSSEKIKNPKYMIIMVRKNKGKSRDINVKIPLFMIRAGVKLSSFLPGGAKDSIGEAFKKNNMDINSDTFGPENFQQMIGIMEEMKIDIDKEDTTVRFRFE